MKLISYDPFHSILSLPGSHIIQNGTRIHKPPLYCEQNIQTHRYGSVRQSHTHSHAHHSIYQPHRIGGIEHLRARSYFIFKCRRRRFFGAATFRVVMMRVCVCVFVLCWLFSVYSTLTLHQCVVVSLCLNGYEDEMIAKCNSLSRGVVTLFIHTYEYTNYSVCNVCACIEHDEFFENIFIDRFYFMFCTSSFYTLHHFSNSRLFSVRLIWCVRFFFSLIYFVVSLVHADFPRNCCNFI